MSFYWQIGGAYIVVGFLLGLLFGSFLNVCIERLPRGESIATPRSRCPKCHAQVRWYDNIPLLSYLFLRARCRGCGERISVRYPLVELGYGVWLACCALFLSFSHVFLLVAPGGDELSRSDVVVKALGAAALGFLLLGLAVMDWRTHKLPDAFTITGIFIGLFLVCVQAIFLQPGQDAITLQHQVDINSAGAGKSMGNVFLTGPEHLVFGRLLAVVSAYLLLWGIRWIYRKVRKRDGMGLGDAKLLAMIAAFLGFAPSLVALFVGVLLATVYGVSLLARGRGNAMTRLPLGTFLCIGGFFAMIWGQPVIGWYTSLFR